MRYLSYLEGEPTLLQVCGLRTGYDGGSRTCHDDGQRECVTFTRALWPTVLEGPLASLLGDSPIYVDIEQSEDGGPLLARASAGIFRVDGDVSIGFSLEGALSEPIDRHNDRESTEIVPAGTYEGQLVRAVGGIETDRAALTITVQ